MKIQIRLHGLDHSKAFSEYATRRIEHMLGRLGKRLSRVVLRVVDTNGPRGGEDKRCRLLISGPRLGTVILTEVRGDVYSATELALYRARRALRQDLGRSRARLEGSAPQGGGVDPGRPGRGRLSWFGHPPRGALRPCARRPR